ncbi:thioredoxin [Bogoriella caseilytica]|uniref:Thioredoxin n=1 Tax=Bogoriella caseilytica TaxID=56055 RepID=A0A3N2B9K6_9MICO|nr:thioredoxin [Bogoriella caseilytica]ROR71888.1 thioredoxin [Bogoriella caseilytica]
MATKSIAEAEFEQTISGEGITLVDFWADWCGPCKQFAPVYERVSEQHPDVTFAKVDTEANQMLSAQLQITAIPTLMAFRDGIQVFSQAGALPAKQLEQLVEQVKGLDMDEVRKQVAENEQSQN